jgi:excisionase family DNA binding protein
MPSQPSNARARLTTPDQEHELLTINETASLLRLQPTTIRSWVWRRKVPFIKLGGRVLFRRTDIEQLIADSVVPASVRRGPLTEMSGVPDIKSSRCLSPDNEVRDGECAGISARGLPLASTHSNNNGAVQ